MKIIKKTIYLIALSVLLFSCKKTGYVKSNGKLTYQYYAGGDYKVSNMIIHDVDESSFESINEQYGKDKKSVFFKGYKILRADPLSFKVLHKTISKDKNYVFEDTLVVKDANAKSYVHIKEEFFKDQNHVFLMGTPIPLMDPHTFEIIEYPYVRDKNHIYCGTVPLMIKDKASFKVTNAGSLRFYENTQAFTSIDTEYKWMNKTKTYYPIFYLEDATAKTNTESFKNFKLLK